MADKPRDFLDLTSLRLSHAPLDGAKFPATLAIGVWENKPQFTLRTGVQSLPKYGLFSISLYPIEFQMVLEGILEIVNTPFTEGEKVNDSITVFDKVGNDAREIGDIVWGRDEKGLMFLCLVNVDQSFPKVVFYITLPRKFKQKSASGQKSSARYARAYVAFWTQTMAKYLPENFVDTSGDRGRGGNSGGGYGGNSGGGYSGSSQASDDDVPF